MTGHLAGATVEVKLARSLIRTILAYLVRSSWDERGGVLLGTRSGPDLWISGAVFPPQLAQARDHCAFDVTCIDLIRTALTTLTGEERRELSDTMVGWVHSHPHHGLFLSDTDQDTLRSWRHLDNDAVAVVIDPFLRDERSRRIAWWRSPTETGSYVSAGPDRQDAMSLSQGSTVASAIARCVPAGQNWDVVTGNGIISVFSFDAEPTEPTR